jgi:excisionase family DNA binding protein
MKNKPSGNDKVQRATLGIKEAARILGIGRNQAYQAARSGELPVLKIGNRILVRRAALDRMLAE